MKVALAAARLEVRSSGLCSGERYCDGAHDLGLYEDVVAPTRHLDCFPSTPGLSICRSTAARPDGRLNGWPSLAANCKSGLHLLVLDRHHRLFLTYLY